MALLVPTTRTVVTFESLVTAFAHSFEAAHGEPPEVVDVATICGKLAMECGRPGPKQSCWCNNVGNVRGVSPEGLFCVLRGAYEFLAIGAALPAGWTEIPLPPGSICPPGQRPVLPPAEQQGFRAYSTLQAACDDYVRVLGARFGHVWRELTAIGTTPRRFVEAMKADRYFTGDVTTYAATVASIARELTPLCESLLQRDADVATFECLSDLAAYGGAATPLRASEAEHTVRLMHTDF